MTERDRLEAAQARLAAARAREHEPLDPTWTAETEAHLTTMAAECLALQQAEEHVLERLKARTSFEPRTATLHQRTWLFVFVVPVLLLLGFHTHPLSLTDSPFVAFVVTVVTCLEAGLFVFRWTRGGKRPRRSTLLSARRLARSRLAPPAADRLDTPPLGHRTADTPAPTLR